MSLSFPFQDEPNQSDRRLVDICPEIKWLRMPLPMSLNHINCYLIKDGDGWCAIDTGMPEQNAHEHWQAIMEEELGGAKLTKVLVTHQHMDHVGLAGHLCRLHTAPLYMSKTEYLTVRAFASSWLDESEPYWHTAEYFARSGVDTSILEGIKNMRKEREKTRGSESPLPSSYVRLQEGQPLKIGDYEWQVICTAGHSPEHVSLFCEALDIYISGDQVLPQITSNVSVMPTEPEANPLQEWIDGLARIKKLLPNSPLVLPSHQLPFKGLHERVDELIAHHEERMGILINACRENSKNATELTKILFDRELEAFSSFMATGECLAHLHCLIEKGEMKREIKEDVYFYSLS
jgi:glyoxylase-like metal-dependent hydrolase (beta-lactamase superfamily II)